MQASSSSETHAAQNDTLLDKMVLSAPAEPIFLVGVALGVLLEGLADAGEGDGGHLFLLL